jgi:predicted ATP-grasp superfamily ATP-dependent carboligase
LLRDLAQVPGVEALTLRDKRLPADVPAVVVRPRSRDGLWPAFLRCLAMCDAVWPIAPEQDDCLERLSRRVVEAGCTLLNSRPEAVRIAASKLRTSQALAAAGVPAVPTWRHAADVPAGVAAIVCKPDDGAGCMDTHVLRDPAQALTDAPTGHVFQPFIEGEALSLSLLCCEGSARLLSVNRQHVHEADGVLHFDGVTVNALPDADRYFADLAARVAAAIPGLWGHVGVDLVHGTGGVRLIEVNPRLTTSCVGLHEALGINLGALVLGLPGSLHATGLLEPGSGRAIDVRLGQPAAHAPEFV